MTFGYPCVCFTFVLVVRQFATFICKSAIAYLAAFSRLHGFSVTLSPILFVLYYELRVRELYFVPIMLVSPRFAFMFDFSSRSRSLSHSLQRSCERCIFPSTVRRRIYACVLSFNAYLCVLILESTYNANGNYVLAHSSRLRFLCPSCC